MSNEEIATLFSKVDQALARIEQQPEQAVIEDILTEDIDTRRAMMQYTLNQLYRAVYPLTEQKRNPRLQLEAIDRILDIMDMECKLWGLYKQPAAKPQPTIIREAQAKPAIVA